MFQVPWRKIKPGVVGIEVSKQGIGLAHIDNTETPPRLQHSEWLLTDGGELPREQLRDRVQQLQLEGSQCNVVLPSGSYSLLLVEAPAVPEAELRDAVRFKIRDMINFPLEEALVDVFQLPEDSSRSGRKMLYVVVVRESQIREIMELVEFTKLTLAHIDISELALRNVVEKNEQNNRGAALVQLVQGRGMLTLMREGQLYLSRQFDLPYNGGLFDEIPEEQLLLELQRSLDYYERQMGQVPPGHIYICGDNISKDKLTDNLTSGVSVEISILNLESLVSFDKIMEESLLQLCLPAIGGALRQQATA